MNKMILLLTLLIFSSSGVAGAYDTLSAYSVSQSFDLGENYYNVYGSPDISASIIGSNEFDRGQTVTLNVDLINNGKLLGFKNDRTPDDADEIYGQFRFTFELLLINSVTFTTFESPAIWRTSTEI
jgi:hypothetical protein